MRKKLYPYFFCCPRFRPLKLTLVVPLLFIVYLVQKDSFVQFWNISSRHYVQFKPSPASPLPNIALKAMQCNPTHRAQSAYQGPITVHLENDQQDLQSLNDARVQRFVDILPQKDLEGIYGMYICSFRERFCVDINASTIGGYMFISWLMHLIPFRWKKSTPILHMCRGWLSFSSCNTRIWSRNKFTRGRFPH